MPSFLSGRYSAVKVRKKLYVTAALLEQLPHRERVLLYSVHCGLRSLESFSWSKEILGRRPFLCRVSLTPQFATRSPTGRTTHQIWGHVRHEIGRCTFDKACTDLFFDVVGQRYEKEGPNAMVLTSNVAPSGWDEFFTGDNTLPCALDRLFDKASVFVMRGPSFRGRELDTYSVEVVPQATKLRGMQPKGV